MSAVELEPPAAAADDDLTRFGVEGSLVEVDLSLRFTVAGAGAGPAAGADVSSVMVTEIAGDVMDASTGGKADVEATG